MRLLHLLSVASALAGSATALPRTVGGLDSLSRRDFDEGKEIDMRHWMLPKRDAERKTCVVKSAGDPDVSDVPAIREAFANCGKGGKIVFSEGSTYAINDFLAMEGCEQCVIEWDGILKQSGNISRILETQQFFTFQNKSTNLQLVGAKGAYIHSPAGTGGIDGQGQIWWEANKNASDLDPGTLRRPMLWTVLRSDHVLIDGIFLDGSPDWNFMIWNSSYVTIQNVAITAISNSTTLAKNTDGLDTYNVDHVLIQNTTVVTGDDCVAWKGNNTQVTARNLVCNGTHGTSVGSLAQYAGIFDYVNGVYVSNITFNGGENAIRIKVWPSGPTHGSALVENVFYKNITTNDVDSPIFLESCYQSNTSFCVKYPSTSTMKNIHIDNVRGTSTGKKNSTIGDLRCPPSANCTVYLTDIDIKPGKGDTEGVFLCEGLENDPGVPCKAATIELPNARRSHFAWDEIKWE